MRATIQQKNAKFARQIRNRQVQAMRAQHRSKLIAHRHQNQKQNLKTLLEQLYPGSQSLLSKILLLIRNLIDTGNSGQMNDQKSNVIGDKNKIFSLLTLDKNAKINIICVNQREQTIQEYIIIDIFDMLSQQICTTIAETNKKLQQISKLTFTNPKIQLIEQLMKSICRVSIQLKQLLQYCNILLEWTVSILQTTASTSLNQRLLEALTSCLIELSCFRPRKYSNQVNSSIVDNVNIIMTAFKDSLNHQTQKYLFSVAKFYTFNILNRKILTNSIYVFGNIFISLSNKGISSQPNDLQSHIRDFIFQSFSNVFRQGLFNDNSAQLASLIVWFIRNEILIVQGMFKTQEKNNIFCENDKMKFSDRKWVQISFIILEKQTKDIKERHELTQTKSTTVCDILALLQLLKNDFDLNPQFIWKAFELIKDVPSLLNDNKGYHKRLRQSIYGFYTDFLETTFDALIDLKPYDHIYAEIHKIIINSMPSVYGLKLCKKALTIPIKTIPHKFKVKVHQDLCSSFDNLVQKTIQLHDPETARQFFQLIMTILRTSGLVMYTTEMQNEFINIKTVKDILQLCQNIWEVQNSPEDIITTLQLLKTLAEIESFQEEMKESIISGGYQQQLQNLSSHPNQDINRLVYEIYQLLDME